MNISYRQLLSSIALIFASVSVNSAIVTYNFNGFVSEVENSAQEFFNHLAYWVNRLQGLSL